MVTHDAFTASYASRILFLQDGAIFTELRKGNDSRSAFFEKILNVLTMIGGGQSHVWQNRNYWFLTRTSVFKYTMVTARAAPLTGDDKPETVPCTLKIEEAAFRYFQTMILP